MSFGQEVIYTQGTAWVECDKCHRRESRHMAGSYSECVTQQNELHSDLIAEGWTYWASRSLRIYCSDCKPSQGHRMADVTASWDRETR